MSFIFPVCKQHEHFTEGRKGGESVSLRTNQPPIDWSAISRMCSFTESFNQKSPSHIFLLALLSLTFVYFWDCIWDQY